MSIPFCSITEACSAVFLGVQGVQPRRCFVSPVSPLQCRPATCQLEPVGAAQSPAKRHSLCGGVGVFIEESENNVVFLHFICSFQRNFPYILPCLLNWGVGTDIYGQTLNSVFRNHKQQDAYILVKNIERLRSCVFV